MAKTRKRIVAVYLKNFVISASTQRQSQPIALSPPEADCIAFDLPTRGRFATKSNAISYRLTFKQEPLKP
jgi:hypothetical protein